MTDPTRLVASKAPRLSTTNPYRINARVVEYGRHGSFKHYYLTMLQVRILSRAPTTPTRCFGSIVGAEHA